MRKGIVHGFLWNTSGQTLIILINLVTNIILARILGPDIFGIFGIVLFFINIANVLVKGGLGGALIRLTKVDENDLKTVFTFNFLVSIFCYLLIFIFSPYIARFYDEPQIQKILVVSGLILFINVFQLLNRALLIREMKFKQIAIYQFSGIFISSVISISAAFSGFGIWSLIILYVGNQFFTTLQIAIFEPFFAKLGWSKKSFKNIYSFGVNTTLSNILNTAFDNIYQLILGKYFSINQVGHFYQAKKLEKVPNTIINSFIQNVLYSGLAKLQNDIPRFKNAYNKVLNTLTALICLMTIIVYIYGDKIILLLYGGEWIDAAFYFQLLIIASFFFIQEKFNRLIFKVFDRTEKLLKLEIVKKIVQSFTILIGVIYKDLNILVGGLVFAYFIGFTLNYYYSKKIIKDYNDINYLVKFIITGIISTVLIMLSNQLIGLNNYYEFLSIPFLVIIYFTILHFTKAFNIKHDFFIIRDIIKR